MLLRLKFETNKVRMNMFRFLKRIKYEWVLEWESIRIYSNIYIFVTLWCGGVVEGRLGLRWEWSLVAFKSRLGAVWARPGLCCLGHPQSKRDKGHHINFKGSIIMNINMRKMLGAWGIIVTNIIIIVISTTSWASLSPSSSLSNERWMVFYMI